MGQKSEKRDNLWKKSILPDSTSEILSKCFFFVISCRPVWLRSVNCSVTFRRELVRTYTHTILKKKEKKTTKKMIMNLKNNIKCIWNRKKKDYGNTLIFVSLEKTSIKLISITCSKLTPNGKNAADPFERPTKNVLFFRQASAFTFKG